MAFEEALTRPRVQKYNTKMTKLLAALPGEEVDFLEQMLGNFDYGHEYIRCAIRDEQPNHPDLDPELFNVSAKTVAKYRDDFYRLVNGL